MPTVLNHAWTAYSLGSNVLGGLSVIPLGPFGIIGGGFLDLFRGVSASVINKKIGKASASTVAVAGSVAILASNPIGWGVLAGTAVTAGICYYGEP